MGDLAAKDWIHRIHNDMRFSKSKPPCKDNFSAVLAPGGHSTKLPYYINIMPYDGSLLAGGVYQPASADLHRIHAAIEDDASPLKRIIGSSDFQKYLGAITGEKVMTAPRGYAKAPPLKLNCSNTSSLLPIIPLTDLQVIAPDFADHVLKVFATMKPFIEYLRP